MTERFERSELDDHFCLAGIGFAKTQAGNCSLMGGMERVRSALQGPFRHLPILAGPSRKGFLGRLTGVPLACLPPPPLTRHVYISITSCCNTVIGASAACVSDSSPAAKAQHILKTGVCAGHEASQRDVASAAAAALCVYSGAHLVRMHSVRLALDAVKVADAVKHQSVPPW